MWGTNNGHRRDCCFLGCNAIWWYELFGGICYLHVQARRISCIGNYSSLYRGCEWTNRRKEWQNHNLRFFSVFLYAALIGTSLIFLPWRLQQNVSTFVPDHMALSQTLIIFSSLQFGRSQQNFNNKRSNMLRFLHIEHVAAVKWQNVHNNLMFTVFVNFILQR